MDCFVLWVCNRGWIVLIHLVSVDSSSIAAYLSLSQMLVIISASLVIISRFLLLSFKVSFLNELLCSPFTNQYFRIWKEGRETEHSASTQKVFLCTEGMNMLLLHDPCDRIFLSAPQLSSCCKLESWRWEVGDKHAELPHAAQHLIEGKESQEGFDPKLQDTLSGLTYFSVLYHWYPFLLR